ncbi:MAG: Flp family type IVb pilin [Planctomycetota bacterium]|jgi:Flp pilus assembly pilin Flp
MLTRLRRTALALHRDDRGADMVEYVLIIAGIALPLLGVIIFFWSDIKDWVFELTGGIKEQVQEAGAPPGS